MGIWWISRECLWDEGRIFRRRDAGRRGKYLYIGAGRFFVLFLFKFNISPRSFTCDFIFSGKLRGFGVTANSARAIAFRIMKHHLLYTAVFQTVTNKQLFKGRGSDVLF